MRKLIIKAGKDLYISDKNSGAEGMPQLEIQLIDRETASVLHSFYMAPFRYYRFQISGNNHGIMDYGESSLADLLEISQCGIQTYVNYKLTVLANEAIESFVKIIPAYLHNVLNMTDDYTLDIDPELSKNSKHLMKEYIDVVKLHLADVTEKGDKASGK